MRKFSFYLIAVLFFASSSNAFASGTKYIVRGQQPTIAWSIGGGTTSCSPTTDYVTNDSDGVRSAWSTSGTTAVGSTVLPSVTTNSGSPYTFKCSASGVSDSATLYVYSEPTETATCTYNSSNSTYSIAVSWSAANASTNPTNYPQRLSGPSHATGDSGGFPIQVISGSDVIGTGGTNDAPTGTSLTWTGLTAPGTYSYWGHVFSSELQWSVNPTTTGAPNSAMSGTVTCTAPAAACTTQTANWGSCSGTLNGVASGQSSTANNSTSGFSGSATYSCSNGTWTQTSQSCTATACANGANDPPTCSQYTITPSATNCTISPSSAQTIPRGGSQNFTINPNSGYSISSVTVDGSSVGAVSSYTFSNVTANHTISASCTASPTTYTITASSGANGSVTPAGSTVVSSGGSQSYTITANSGYTVASVTVDGSSVGAVTSYTFSNVTANHTISATFTASAGAQCSGTSKTWMTSCSGTLVLASDGTPQTLNYNNGTYSGSATYTCSNGTWTGPTNASCALIPSSPTITVNSNCVIPSGTSTCASTITWNSVGQPNPAVCQRNEDPIGTIKGSCTVLSTSASGSNFPVSLTMSRDAFFLVYGPTQSSFVSDYKDPSCASGSSWNGTICAASLPDLTASVAYPNSAAIGNPVTLSSLISNIGSASTGSSFNNFFQVATATNGGGTITDLASVSMSTLAASASASTTKSYTFAGPPGTYSIRACADKANRSDGGTIPESNEGNNCSPSWVNVTVTCPSGSSWNGSSCTTTPPTITVNDPGPSCNYTTPCALKFTCTNATTYAIYKDNTTFVATTTYSGPVNQSINLQGNYNMICINAAGTDSSVLFYSPTPLPTSNLILSGTPRTIDSGGKVTLSWSITNPSTSCKITATPVCVGTCSAAQVSATNALTSTLSTGTTDTNDPNGASRNMSTALQTVASGSKALGKKTLQVQYTTDFGLSCGTSTATSSVRVIVSRNTEG